MPVTDSPSESLRALELFEEQEELEAFQREALRAMEEFHRECEADKRERFQADREMEEFEDFLATRRCLPSAQSAWDQFQEYKRELVVEPLQPPCCMWCERDTGAIFCPCMEQIEDDFNQRLAELELATISESPIVSTSSETESSESLVSIVAPRRWRAIRSRLARMLRFK